jgi:hypothetical protein
MNTARDTSDDDLVLEQAQTHEDWLTAFHAETGLPRWHGHLRKAPVVEDETEDSAP